MRAIDAYLCMELQVLREGDYQIEWNPWLALVFYSCVCS